MKKVKSTIIGIVISIFVFTISACTTAHKGPWYTNPSLLWSLVGIASATAVHQFNETEKAKKKIKKLEAE